MAGHHRRRPDIAEDEKPPELVYVGMRLGGGVLEKPYVEIERAIGELRRTKHELQAPGPEDLRIDLVFDVPGSLWRPRYEGVRTGRFSMVERMLQIQVAVPDEITGPDMPHYLTEVLTQMVDAAKGYVKRRKLPLSTEALERAVGELIARLQA